MRAVLPVIWLARGRIWINTHRPQFAGNLMLHLKAMTAQGTNNQRWMHALPCRLETIATVKHGN